MIISLNIKNEIINKSKSKIEDKGISKSKPWARINKLLKTTQ